MLIPLAVKGQGVFLFHTTAQDVSSCILRLSSADESTGLTVEFTSNRVLVKELQSLKPLDDPANTKGLSDLSGAYYWFSLDAQNQRLHAGVGEARLETAIYTYTFPDHQAKGSLESITHVTYPTTVKPIRTLRDPIRRRIPLAVKDTHELTMDHIAADAFLPKANLPPYWAEAL